MKERPILMSAPMVRAILEGRKSQTRRIVKLPAWAQECNEDHDFELDGSPPWPHAIARKTGCLAPLECPYGAPGDRLWVRETWAMLSGDNRVWYRADPGVEDCVARSLIGWPGWHPSIFMPRENSRITLEVTAVRVERLQEITSADAIAEGCAAHANSQTIDCSTPDPRDDYRRLWDSLNAKRAPWSSNPWVWVVEFKSAPESP